MTPIKLYQIETQELQAIIPDIEQSLRSMTPLTATIVTEMINTFKVGAEATFSYLKDIADTPIGKVIQFAINAWMPWLNPLLNIIPSDITDTTTETIEIETPPFPTITPPPGDTDREKAKKVKETLIRYSEITYDQSIIGPGFDRKQLLRAIAAFDTQLNQLNTSLRNERRNLKRRATITNLENFIKSQINVRAQYKLALSWVLKNYPQKTP